MKLQSTYKGLGIFLIAFLVVGCDGRPEHVVYGNVDMVVYSMKAPKKDEDEHKAGKYEYWITDQTTGWALRTDKVFTVGDKVEINASSNSK